MNMKPFLLKNPTEKENMCLHKYCLNLCLLFNTLMEHSRNNGPSFDSISKLFMHASSCEYHSNGYWKSECCLGKCSDCKSIEKINRDRNYQRWSQHFRIMLLKPQSMNILEQKGFTRKVQLLNSTIAYGTKEAVTFHRYQIENDKCVATNSVNNK